MSKLRKLRFKKLKDVLEDAESLLETGYRQGGEWSLGEICDHLARSMTTVQVEVASRLPGVLQFGAYSFGYVFGRATRGVQIPTLLPPRNRISDEKGVRRLAKAIKRFKKSNKRSKDAWIVGEPLARRGKEFHLWHCSHHLSFLEPVERALTRRSKRTAVFSSESLRI